METKIANPADIARLIKSIEGGRGKLHQAEPLYSKFGYPFLYTPSEYLERLEPYKDIYDLNRNLDTMTFPVRLKYQIDQSSPVREEVWWMPLFWLNHFFPDRIPEKILDYETASLVSKENPDIPFMNKPAVILYMAGWKLEAIKGLVGTREDFARIVEETVIDHKKIWPYGVDEKALARLNGTVDEDYEIRKEARLKAPRQIAADLESIRWAMIEGVPYGGDERVTRALNRIAVAGLHTELINWEKDPRIGDLFAEIERIKVDSAYLKRYFGEYMDKPNFWRFIRENGTWKDIDPVSRSSRLIRKIIDGENEIREAVLDFMTTKLGRMIAKEVMERYSYGFDTRREAYAFMLERLFFVDARRRIIGTRTVERKRRF